MNKMMNRRHIYAVLASALAVVAATAVTAADYHWDNGSGDGKWFTANNWYSTEFDNTLPPSDATAHVGSSPHASVATSIVDQPGAVANTLKIGYNTGTKGTLIVADGSLEVASRIDVGVSGLGRLVQSNGTISAASYIFVATQPDRPGGTIELVGGHMQTPHLYLGERAQGTVKQSGGTNRVTTTALLSNNSWVHSIYELSGGLFNPLNLDVGRSGTGTVLQTGGVLKNDGNIKLGVNADGVGNYCLSNGTLNSGSLYVGNLGKGFFTQTGGVITNSGQTQLGVTTTGAGNYSLSNGIFYSDSLYVGNYGNGVFTQTGGTNQITKAAYVGNYASSKYAIYELSGGVLKTLATTTAEGLKIGVSTTGIVHQTGGVLETSGQTQLGSNADGVGHYLLENGTLSSDSLYVGNHGEGVFTQTGGTNTVIKYLILPRYNTGVYNMWGGELLIGKNGVGDAGYLSAGFDGVEGTFNFGTTNSSGVIRDTPGVTKPSFLVVGFREGVKGTFRGWGLCELSGYLSNNGIVLADGYGNDRDLDFSPMGGGVTKSFANTGINGWYAQDHGRLLLPPINAGSSVYWGDLVGGIRIHDLVNSVRLELVGSGVVTGALLAVDHTLINPGLYKPIGVWNFSGDPSITEGTLTFLYDAAQLAAMDIDERRLHVWRYNGIAWEKITEVGGLDTESNMIRTVTVNPFGQFAVAPIVQGTIICVD